MEAYDFCMEVYNRDDFSRFNTGQFWTGSVISPEIRTGCCQGCDWLQQNRTRHKIRPVLSFPHASPATAPQPSTALWRDFEVAHGVNSTKFVSICCCVACGCGCRVCLRRPVSQPLFFLMPSSLSLIIFFFFFKYFCSEICANVPEEAPSGGENVDIFPFRFILSNIIH